MATGRTVSANFLTPKDHKIISLCDEISNTLLKHIERDSGEFLNVYGKISYTRDGGAGVGGGKLQRDALCTRGRQGKAPFSNRNLRWHPLVVAEAPISNAKEIDAIKIEGTEESQTLVFIVNGKEYPSDKVHELSERFVALPKQWMPHINKMKFWSDTLWTQNSCVIPALEACNWEDAVETYAMLGIAVAVELYKVDFEVIFNKVVDTLRKQNVDDRINLPSGKFKTDKLNIVSCPMCEVPISQKAASMPVRKRETVWQPAWRARKRKEGEESSIQIMHMQPLIDSAMNHNAKNVRYGHRWCNVAMTDHSLSETLDFMEYIVRAHNRCK